ncbi:MAG: hypothetical protein IJU64_01815 [Bacilli bacterium]|nr:hypothetical protein [Bacilli bacterium]
MNSAYLYEYAALLERVFSVAHASRYADAAVERAISYSPFFQSIEGNRKAPIFEERALLKAVFPELDVLPEDVPVYNQCLWAAEAYLRIQAEIGLTFEAIFLYFPLREMYDCFPLYHEMDFSQIVGEFKKAFQEKSVLDLLFTKYRYSVKEVSLETGIPYQTLFSLKRRRRAIGKVGAASVIALARVFHVRVETITESKVGNL